MTKQAMIVFGVVGLMLAMPPACIFLDTRHDKVSSGPMCITQAERLELARYTTGCSGFNAGYCQGLQTGLVCPEHEVVVHRTFGSWPNGKIVKVIR
jgi:hypothetical protein